MKKLILIFLISIAVLNAKETIKASDFRSLQNANKLIEKNKLNQAKTSIENLLKKDVNNLTKSYALQSLANIHLKRNNYKNVAKAYEKIIAYKALEQNDILKIKYSLSKIYFSLENYSKSLKYSKELLNSKVVKDIEIYENMALAYYYNKQYKKSTSYIKKVLQSKKGLKKKESWYRMLYSAYVESKNYKLAINTLRSMVKKYSENETYWMQLISLYEKTKQKRKSLATLELTYKKNIVSKEKNLLYLVSILSDYGIYNKAAIYMQKALNKSIVKNNQKNFNILVSLYLNAKNYDKAINLLENSSFAKNDKYQLILGNIYYNQNNFKNAIRVLQKHKFKANTRSDGKRYTLLALSYYELNDKNKLTKYLKKASKNKYEKRRARVLAKDLGYKI
ncbi:tetratricopeptide repeat protein [Arcobacter sp. YIC-310]|uniref:tetratricopeptide repeat protein n=1 Tax=Arcobacter sp. YIC-310 TaxID=3376632 RepID=UPI003C1447C7